jgi:hypothetical protein
LLLLLLVLQAVLGVNRKKSLGVSHHVNTAPAALYVVKRYDVRSPQRSCRFIMPY